MSNSLLFIAGSDIDYFYEVNNFPNVGEAAESKFIEAKVGGCVLNAASVASMLGSDVKVLDSLNSEDEDTTLILEALKGFNVDTSHMILNKDTVNGKCIIMRKDDEKIIYVIEPKKTKIVRNKIDTLLNSTSYIYSLATILNDTFVDLSILDYFKQNNIKLILDASNLYTNKKDADILLKYADGFFINKSSFTRLCNTLGYNPLKDLFNRGLLFACITDGANGVTCYDKGNEYYQPAYKVDVVDSTGAGDSFAGCFMHFYSEGYAIEECLEFASASGAYACTKNGGMAGAISKDELFKFIKENKRA